MFTLILEQSTPEQIEDDIDDIAPRIYRLVIGSIAVLFDAISMNSLHRLLATTASSAEISLGPAEIEATLVGLGSVIDIPFTEGLPDTDASVRIFHPSFRAFLLHRRQLSLEHLQLDYRALHETMLRCCLNVMDTHLRKNICHLPGPDSDPSTLAQDIVESYIPPHVQYACKHWISHPERLSKEALILACADDGSVRRFLANKAVYWIEASSILGVLPQAVVNIGSLRSLLNDSDININAPIVNDVYHLLLVHGEPISRAPLHIYSLPWPSSLSVSVIWTLVEKDILV
ncbi:hypothetical protein BJX66DRAFT_314873, partial [Aspergillus keveii]